jgi:rubrerythrin
MPNRTEDNLQTAFMGESAAVRRYTLYAEKAEQEGLPQVARLFRAAAASEAIHARNHLNVIGGVGSTRDNLLAAAIGEHQETIGLYPVMIGDARAELHERAEQTFRWANAVEKGHYGMFESVLAAVKAGEAVPATKYSVCRTCGNTVGGAAPATCPVCGASQSYDEVD